MATKKAFDETFLNGVIQVAATVGIENLRTKQVADYTGFSEATLFRAFETKELLLCSAFLRVDNEISHVLSDLVELRGKDDAASKRLLSKVWDRLFGFLSEKKEQTLFWMRFRYSSLYTDDVREKREAFNGGLSPVYDALSEHYTGLTSEQLSFLLQTVVETTACLAEKNANGKAEELDGVSDFVWATASAAARRICFS